MLTNLLLNILKATAIQLLGVLGIFFAFGFVLNQLQKWTQTNYRRAFGWAGILFTAWFGTPIHELGHVFFAKLFRHRVDHVSLFSPNETTGSLGHVEHSYNRGSLYQKIGNFFVGAAPMIFGGGFLFLMVYYLLPNGPTIFTNENMHWSIFWQSIGSFFSLDNLRHWSFWLFFYLALCVIAHLSPSKYDRRSMWLGLGWIVFILLGFNAILVLVQLDITTNLLQASQRWLRIFVQIFMLATILATIHWLLSLLLLPIAKLRRH